MAEKNPISPENRQAAEREKAKELLLSILSSPDVPDNAKWEIEKYDLELAYLR